MDTKENKKKALKTKIRDQRKEENGKKKGGKIVEEE